MTQYFCSVKWDAMGSDRKGWDRMGSAWLVAFNQSNAIRVDNMSQMRESCWGARGERCYKMVHSYDYIDYIARHPRQSFRCPSRLNHPSIQPSFGPVSRM